MADIKTALYGYLSTQGSITTLVGTRIYPSVASPSAVEPYIVVDRIDLHDIAPWQSAASTTDRTTLQLAIWGQTSVSVEAVVAALRTLLDGFRGVMGLVWIQAWRFTNALDGVLAPSDGSLSPGYRTTLTCDVIYTTAA